MFGNALRLTLLWAAIGMALTGTCSDPVQYKNSGVEVIDDVAKYHCNGGFRFEGKNRESICKDSSWEKMNFSCQKTCGAPPKLSYATLAYAKEELAIYKCIQDVNQNIELKCHEQNWKIPENSCMEVSTTTLLNSTDGNVNDTFMTITNISTTVDENGTLDEVNATTLSPKNSESCPEPMDISNGITQISDGEGNDVNYSCLSGYIQVGNLSTSFCENGTWTEIDINCFPESCGLPPHVPSSKVTADGNTANFTCESEFVLIGNASTSICENGSWSEIDMTCISKAVLMMESRLRKESKEFQEKLENSDTLICSFNGDEPICRCNNMYAIIETTPNQKIAKHSFISVHTESLQLCEELCLDNESCMSLEFRKSTKICQLSRTTSYLVESIIIMEDKDVIYGEKVCKEYIMEGSTAMPYKTFNLSMNQPSALLCSMSKEEMFCGCIDGKVSFKIEINKKIGMHNMFSFKAEDYHDCAEKCRVTQNCLSAEFKHSRKICHLSMTARYLADEYIFRNSANTFYLEKLCTPFDNIV